MDKETLLKELKKLNPKHPRITFFEQNDSNIALKLLAQSVEREKRIQNIHPTASPAQAKAKASIATPPTEPSDDEPAEDLAPAMETFESLRTRILKANPTFRYEDLPADLQAKYDEIGQLYQKRTALHEKAKASDDPEIRAEAINEAAAISDRISLLYEHIDAYVNASAVPSQGSEVAEKLKRLNNINSTLSKRRAALKAADGAPDTSAKLQAEIDDLEREKKELTEWKKSLKA